MNELTKIDCVVFGVVIGLFIGFVYFCFFLIAERKNIKWRNE